jgi:hypothetical protein
MVKKRVVKRGRKQQNSSEDEESEFNVEDE